MAKNIGEINDLIPVLGLDSVIAAEVSDLMTVSSAGPHLIIVPILTGAVTNSSITVSIGLIDSNGKEMWTAPQELQIRTLPNGTQVCQWGIFELYRCTTHKVAIESAITGGGSITVYETNGVL